MSASLDGVRAKIERAKGYFVELKKEILFWRDADHVAVAADEHHPEGKGYVFITAIKPPPPHLPFVLGDCVHNLRSALDHLAYQLAIISLCTPNRDTAFCIWKSKPAEKDFKKRLKFFRADIASDIESFQPYNRRPTNPMSDPLYILSELDNIDKHRTSVLIPVDWSVAMAADGTIVEPSEAWQREEGGKILFGRRFEPITPQPKTRPNIHTQLPILIKDTGLCCDFQPVLPTIRVLIEEVEAVVSSFAKFF